MRSIPHFAQIAPFTFIEAEDGGTVTRGYMIDLMYLIGRRLGVQVHFYTPADNRWGTANEQGEWNGMIGEVIKREVSVMKVKFMGVILKVKFMGVTLKVKCE